VILNNKNQGGGGGEKWLKKGSASHRVEKKSTGAPDLRGFLRGALVRPRAKVLSFERGGNTGEKKRVEERRDLICRGEEVRKYKKRKKEE